MELLLKEHCFINTNIKEDKFVGLKVEGSDYQIHFPLGFQLSDNDEDVRHDIMLLLSILARYTDKTESDDLKNSIKDYSKREVLMSYIYIIQDFLSRGYYKEQVAEYASSKVGKIDWSRTIKNKCPAIIKDNLFYLEFITKKKIVSETDIITLIHMYCVFRSFFMIGWLFTNYIPLEPQIEFDKAWFSNVISRKLANTFNDQNKELFKSMLNIILDESEYGLDVKGFTFGTTKFEYIWQCLVDSVFGIENKSSYFPRTYWKLLENEKRINYPLMPDTIMLHDGNIYILDAKYYQYGYTRNIKDLPGSDSINKQITYGEYIAKNKINKNSSTKIYNAFIMPFSAYRWQTGMKVYIGEAFGNWKNGDNEYEKVKGIMIDVKYLMEISGMRNVRAINELASLIKKHS